MTHRFDAGIDRGTAFTITVDDAAVRAFPGESVAAALLGDGRRAFRRTARTGAPRSLYCGMGVCWDCLVTIDGRSGQRACMTEAQPGMRVLTGRTGLEPEAGR